jgi:hypothetical protein
MLNRLRFPIHFMYFLIFYIIMATGSGIDLTKVIGSNNDDSSITSDMKLDILCKGQEEMMKSLQLINGQISSLSKQYTEVKNELVNANEKNL